MTVGSRTVHSRRGLGAGLLIKGKGAMVTSGSDFDQLQERFPWRRAVLLVTLDSIEQTL